MAEPAEGKQKDHGNSAVFHSPDDAAYTALLTQSFVFRGYIKGSEHRAVTFQQLLASVQFGLAHCASWQNLSKPRGHLLSTETLNLHHFNDWVIKPATKEADCSCAEMIANGPQDPSWFVSHWWGGRLREFIECLALHARTRQVKDAEAFWVCAFALRQNKLQEALPGEPKDRSFIKAMKMSIGVVLILDSKSDTAPFTGPATPFSRTWCMYELTVAIVNLRKSVDILTCTKEKGPAILTEDLTIHESKVEKSNQGWGHKLKVERESAFPIEVLMSALDVRIETGATSVEIENTRILNTIVGRKDLDKDTFGFHEHYNKANKRIRSNLAVLMWCQAVMVNETSEFDAHRLGVCLEADSWRENLVLNFGHCSKMDDEHLTVLAKGLPSGLSKLELNFWMCQSITNHGLEELAKALPTGLKSLSLNFQHCNQLDSTGVNLLSTSIPSGLTSLRLSFEHVSGIQSTAGLARGIGRLEGLRFLSLDFTGLEGLRDTDLVALAEALIVTKVRTLNFVFKGCQLLSDEGVQAITKRFHPRLEALNLNFACCEKITDESLDHISDRFVDLTSLSALLISFEDCPEIAEASVSRFARRLPLSLTGAKLNLAGTGVSADVQKICRRLPTMREWMPLRQPSKLSTTNNSLNDTTRSKGSKTGKSPGLLLRSVDLYLPRGLHHGFVSPTAAANAHNTYSKAETRSSSKLKAVTLQRAPTADPEEPERPLSRAWSEPYIKPTKDLLPRIARPVRPIPSGIVGGHPESMFHRPRTSHNGHTEPHWCP
eukprot:TRINITY_DN8593_c2_g1_i1.p1 TRINITY_DN8593_c2_g1~~TRINITY_DN8593_c2_g1_i1.p1  ORF type:complete len:774 (+),score=112.82 TRINITY_DN8593_c2_g1_i1:133-2454(+)